MMVWLLISKHYRHKRKYYLTTTSAAAEASLSTSSAAERRPVVLELLSLATEGRLLSETSSLPFFVVLLHQRATLFLVQLNVSYLVKALACFRQLKVCCAQVMKLFYYFITTTLFTSMSNSSTSQSHIVLSDLVKTTEICHRYK